MLPNKYNWKIKKPEISGNIIEQILSVRGITSLEERNTFLNLDKTQLYSPYLLNDMEKAVHAILECKVSKRPIVIYGDYDVGATRS